MVKFNFCLLLFLTPNFFNILLLLLLQLGKHRFFCVKFLLVVEFSLSEFLFFFLQNLFFSCLNILSKL